MSYWYLFLIIGLCLLSEGFFSGSEIAMISANRLNLRIRADKGHRGSILALKMLDRPEWLLGTCLIGTNLSMVTSTTLATFLASTLFSREATLYVPLFMIPLVLVFGEMTPKSLFEHYANRLAPIIVYPLRLVSVLFTPALFVIDWASRLMLRLIHSTAEAGAGPVSREEILLILDSSDKNDIDEEDRDYIKKILEFGDNVVQDAMVPLIEVVGLPETATVTEAAQTIVETGFSRIPVFQERVDNIVGLVGHRDVLFSKDRKEPVSNIMKSVPFIPETKRLEELFSELRRERQRFAVVVDEYGGAVGIITVEDILEEIVGEIEDEFDQEPAAIKKMGDHTWAVEGRVERELLEEKLGLLIPEGDFETLAGFILTRCGRIPSLGTRLTWGGWNFIVSGATERAVTEILVTKDQKLQEDLY